MPRARNLFSSLNRYARRQEENFLTEGLAYLLELLRERETDAFRALLELITGTELPLETANLTINTQETTEVGRPDLVIEQVGDLTAFVEIKHDSSLGTEQLERYAKQLQQRNSSQKYLVLLTRSRHSMRETSLSDGHYRLICWYQISALLTDLELSDNVCYYVVDEFLEFLAEKEMSVEKIEWEYIQGVPALRNLANMIGTALAEAFPEAHVRRTAGWSWIGYYFSGKSWFGLRYDDPLTIVVENEGEVDPKPIRRLDLEAEHFFSLKAGEQLELLIRFVEKSVEELGIDLKNEPISGPDDET